MELYEIQLNNMPYKDKQKQKEYFKEYKLKNKDRCNELSLKLYHKKKLLKEWKDNRNTQRELNRIERVKAGRPEKRTKESMINRMLKIYGLNHEDYTNILKQQNGVCKVCGGNRNIKPYKLLPLAVDHCHVTKLVRGLLCRKCNTLLGMADDNVDILQKAINYLKDNE